MSLIKIKNCLLQISLLYHPIERASETQYLQESTFLKSLFHAFLKFCFHSMKKWCTKVKRSFGLNEQQQQQQLTAASAATEHKGLRDMAAS